MIKNFNVKKYIKKGKTSIYEITYIDESLHLLSLFFNIISIQFVEGHLKSLEDIVAFKNTDEKIKYANEVFNGIWEDHPYPDDSIVMWDYIETTWNNLGTLVTIATAGESLYVVYSFTLEKVYIVYDPFIPYDEETPAEILEIDLDKFIDKLIWWKEYIQSAEQGEVEVEVEIL